MYKSTILFGVVLLAAFSAGQDTTCPQEDPKNETVMLPYPNDCTKFYMCHAGQAIQMNCPWGTYFNANESICDWPQNSGCVQPNPPSVCNPADLVPLYPVANNCSAFIMCQGSQQIQMGCPDGLYFSASMKVCTWPQDSGCVQPSTPAPSTEVPTSAKTYPSTKLTTEVQPTRATSEKATTEAKSTYPPTDKSTDKPTPSPATTEAQSTNPPTLKPSLATTDVEL